VSLKEWILQMKGKKKFRVNVYPDVSGFELN